MKKYFMVHNPENRFPAEKHETFPSAQREAKRLASKEVGKTFIILEAITGFKVELPEPSVVVLEDPEATTFTR